MFGGCIWEVKWGSAGRRPEIGHRGQKVTFGRLFGRRMLANMKA